MPRIGGQTLPNTFVVDSTELAEGNWQKIVHHPPIVVELLEEPPVAANKTKVTSWRPLARLRQMHVAMIVLQSVLRRRTIKHADEWTAQLHPLVLGPEPTWCRLRTGCCRTVNESSSSRFRVTKQNLLSAKAAVDEEWEKLGKIPAWVSKLETNHRQPLKKF